MDGVVEGDIPFCSSFNRQNLEEDRGLRGI